MIVASSLVGFFFGFSPEKKLTAGAVADERRNVRMDRHVYVIPIFYRNK
jgi:hypothetical protein